MSYSIRIDESFAAVIVTREGEAELEELTASHAEVLSLLRERGLKRVLADTSGMTSGLSGAQNYEYTSRLVFSYPAGTRIAVIVSAAVWDAADLGAKISGIRGLSVRIFADEASARSWLGEESDATR